MRYESSRPRTTSPPSAGIEETLDLHGAGRSSVIALPGAAAAEARHGRIEALSREMLLELGEDPDREGLLRTPRRVAESLEFLTSGYGQDLRALLNGAVFDAEGYREMVLVRDVEFYSLCEHHLLPFFGRVSVAYLPGRKVIGLSKIPRIVDVYARRLQLQERLTNQVASALEELLAPRGVAVTATAFHLCMAMRGVSKQQSQTATVAFTGDFKTDPSLRREFLAAAGGRGAPPDGL